MDEVVVGTGPHSGGWVCSQLSSDTIRAFHGIAGIRDVGMTGKDLGPMLLGVYSAVRGIFSSRCFRRWSVADRTYGRSDTVSGSLQSRRPCFLGCGDASEALLVPSGRPPSYPLHTNKEKANQTKNYSYPLFYCKALII